MQWLQGGLVLLYCKSPPPLSVLSLTNSKECQMTSWKTCHKQECHTYGGGHHEAEIRAVERLSIHLDGKILEPEVPKALSYLQSAQYKAVLDSFAIFADGPNMRFELEETRRRLLVSYILEQVVATAELTPPRSSGTPSEWNQPRAPLLLVSRSIC
jgi:hypothetical protein